MLSASDAYVGGSKQDFVTSAGRRLRDATAVAAATSERAPVSRSGTEGPTLRMSSDEGATLSERNSASMAHMALSLHSEFAFTDACATDGSLIPAPDNAPPDSPRGRPRTAWGLFRGPGRTLGGGMAAGSTVQDAETEAIRRCLRQVRQEAGTAAEAGARRVLILGDSLSVLLVIEQVWREGTYDALRSQHRRAMLEDITRLRLELGGVVFLWVRGHGGVFPNAYADTVAKAFLDEAPDGESPTQRVSLVRYLTGGAGHPWTDKVTWAAEPADRKVMHMTEAALQRWCVQQYLIEERKRVAHGGHGPPWLDERRLLGRKSGWWTAVVRSSSSGGRRAGSRTEASDVGAVMMLRDGKLGLPAEWDTQRAHDDVVGALLADREESRGTTPGGSAASELASCLHSMLRAVPRPPTSQTGARGTSRYHRAVDAALELVEAVQAGTRPTNEAWLAARQVFAGFLPTPPKSCWTRTRAGSLATDDTADGPAATAAREVSAAVGRASMAIWKAARSARQADARRRAAQEGAGHGPVDWRTVLQGDESEASDLEEDDDDADWIEGQGDAADEDGEDSDADAGGDDGNAGVDEDAGAPVQRTADAQAGQCTPAKAARARAPAAGADPEANGQYTMYTIVVPPGAGHTDGGLMGIELLGRHYTVHAPAGAREGSRLWLVVDGADLLVANHHGAMERRVEALSGGGPADKSKRTLVDDGEARDERARKRARAQGAREPTTGDEAAGADGGTADAAPGEGAGPSTAPAAERPGQPAPEGQSGRERR